MSSNFQSSMSQDATFQPPEDNTEINVKVLTTTGYDEVFFKIRCTTKLSKLRSAFANKVGKNLNDIRLLYDENRINDDDTPASLEMEDNDTIMADCTSCFNLFFSFVHELKKGFVLGA